MNTTTQTSQLLQQLGDVKYKDTINMIEKVFYLPTLFS